MKGRVLLALTIVLGACGQDPELAGEEPATAANAEVDPVLLRELLGESVRVDGEQVHADGMLIRLAFDPLIRGTGPASLQLVQGQGYRLSGVADSSPLWLLGLRDGDVLTGVDRQAIIGREHELRSVYEARPTRVELTFMRGTEAHTIHLRIASGSAWRLGAGGLDVPLDVAQLPPSAPPVPAPERPSLPNEAAVAEFASGLSCVAANPNEVSIGRCELERKAFDNLRAQPEVLARTARVVPAIQNGEARGFKLYGIRPGSIASLLGFKNGDLIASINGRLLGSIDAALSAYEALRDETEFRVAFERKGTTRELEIAIVDKLSGPAAGLRVQEAAAALDPDTSLRDPFATSR